MTLNPSVLLAGPFPIIGGSTKCPVVRLFPTPLGSQREGDISPQIPSSEWCCEKSFLSPHCRFHFFFPGQSGPPVPLTPRYTRPRFPPKLFIQTRVSYVFYPTPRPAVFHADLPLGGSSYNAPTSRFSACRGDAFYSSLARVRKNLELAPTAPPLPGMKTPMGEWSGPWPPTRNSRMRRRP